MKVLKLSSKPDIPNPLFCNLGGNFEVRVCAVNRAGRGACAEKSIVLPGGYLLTFLYIASLFRVTVF